MSSISSIRNPVEQTKIYLQLENALNQNKFQDLGDSEYISPQDKETIRTIRASWEETTRQIKAYDKNPQTKNTEPGKTNYAEWTQKKEEQTQKWNSLKQRMISDLKGKLIQEDNISFSQVPQHAVQAPKKAASYVDKAHESRNTRLWVTSLVTIGIAILLIAAVGAYFCFTTHSKVTQDDYGFPLAHPEYVSNGPLATIPIIIGTVLSTAFLIGAIGVGVSRLKEDKEEKDHWKLEANRITMADKIKAWALKAIENENMGPLVRCGFIQLHEAKTIEGYRFRHRIIEARKNEYRNLARDEQLANIPAYQDLQQKQARLEKQWGQFRDTLTAVKPAKPASQPEEQL